MSPACSIRRISRCIWSSERDARRLPQQCWTGRWARLSAARWAMHSACRRNCCRRRRSRRPMVSSTASFRLRTTIPSRRACRPARSPTTPNRRCCSAASCWNRASCFDHKRWVNALIAWERDVKAARQLRPAGAIDQARNRRHQQRCRAGGGRPRRRHQRCGDAHRASRHHDAAGPLERWSPRWPRPAGRHTTPRSPSRPPPRWPPPSATASTAAIGARPPAMTSRLRARCVQQGNWIVGADVAARIGWACELVRGKPASEAIPA